MSFLGRIVQQAQSPVVSGYVVARPKGLLPSLPATAAPVDRPAYAEPVSSQTEPLVAASAVVPPTIAGPSDETPPAPSISEPDIRSRPGQSALEQRLATVAGADGLRPEDVDATDLDRPEPTPAADAETAHEEAFGGRNQEPAVRAEPKGPGTAAPPSDDQQHRDERPTPAAPVQKPFASPPETPADQVSRLPPVEAAPATASIGRPVSVATEQAAEQAKSASDQALADADADQSEPQAPPVPVRQAENTTGAPRPEPPPVLEPVPPPQPELYRPAPSIQPPAPDQPPLLQIDQIDVVVSDPAPAQPAAPARSRLAAISASRRYLRRL